jgi:phosphatidylinositol alpha-1,6-mannosyltransferase
VYLFSFDYPPLPGGIARLCSEIARELDRRRALTAVLTTGQSPTPRSREIRVPAPRPRSELSALRFLAGRPDHEPVLCGRWWPEAAVALAARRGPVFALAHGMEIIHGRGARAAVRRPLRRAVLERCALVFANSAFTAGVVQRSAPGARCVALPLAVDPERFSPGARDHARARLGLPENVRVIATVARVQSNKGHATVLRGLAALPADERRQLCYAVVGAGPHRPALEALVSSLGVTESVRFLGHVDEALLPEVYRAADLHALLSEHTDSAVEGFGLASLEAQACGTPALGTASGGAADAIPDGAGGWLIDAGDVAAVRTHLSGLVHSPERYRVAGEAARRRVLEMCTWQHYGDALLAHVTHSASEIPR